MTDRAPHAPGIAHSEFPTPDIDATRAFYEDTLGFPVVVDTTGRIEDGGELRHLFFQVGEDQFVAFMEAREVPGLESPGDVAAGLGVPDPMLHLAFKAGSLEALEERRAKLAGAGVKTSPIIDFGWCRSFYFKDPHGLMLEYTCVTQPPGEDGEPGRFELEMSLDELEHFAGLR